MSPRPTTTSNSPNEATVATTHEPPHLQGRKLSAGDRIREITRLGLEMRATVAERSSPQGRPDRGSDPVTLPSRSAIHSLTEHLAALEATGVLDLIAEAADLFECDTM